METNPMKLIFIYSRCLSYTYEEELVDYVHSEYDILRKDYSEFSASM